MHLVLRPFLKKTIVKKRDWKLNDRIRVDVTKNLIEIAPSHTNAGTIFNRALLFSMAITVMNGSMNRHPLSKNSFRSFNLLVKWSQLLSTARKTVGCRHRQASSGLLPYHINPCRMYTISCVLPNANAGIIIEPPRALVFLIISDRRPRRSATGSCTRSP